ncbi:MAG: intermembrane phospholipid transport protein YdbH family protein, partial [Janthinobacterium lividum]
LRLIGTAGARAFAVDARPGRITVGGTTAAPRFATPGLTAAIDLGGLRASATVSGELAGGARGWSGSGRVADAGTTVAALRISDGAAAWRLAGGALTLDAGARIADTEAVPRFAPLRLAATGLRLDRTGVAGHGSIRLAAGGTPIATVTGDYRFGPATGTAVVDSTLVFSDTFQPFQLSELARGLAANVAGSVAGHADLRLAAGTVGGTARVRIDHVSLATAALGPVTGIDGSIAFDDLPRLHTPPGQTLAVASINPGVVVDDGVVGFQLLDATTIAVERIRWPFAGGSLTLAPVTIRAGQTSRRFVLAVDGLDAEQFLQRFQLKNFNATGRFDGVLPLVFDGGGGRIDGGVLTARAGGGLLQYVGNVGQDSMGGAGRLAFDALRRMRYRALRLRLDGDLDGELVTAVDFVGTNEVPVRAAGPLPIRTTGLPFKFAVTVRAPFRALLGTAQSFSDARAMIRAGAPVQH